MECRRIVAGVEVYKSKVVADDPLEWIKIQRLFEAGNGGDEPLLAEEAHACVPARKRDWAGGDGYLRFRGYSAFGRRILLFNDMFYWIVSLQMASPHDSVKIYATNKPTRFFSDILVYTPLNKLT